MKALGIILLLAGAILMAYGFTMDITVSGEYSFSNRVANISLIARQTTFINTGGFILVAGAIFVSRADNQISN